MPEVKKVWKDDVEMWGITQNDKWFYYAFLSEREARNALTLLQETCSNVNCVHGRPQDVMR